LSKPSHTAACFNRLLLRPQHNRSLDEPRQLIGDCGLPNLALLLTGRLVVRGCPVAFPWCHFYHCFGSLFAGHSVSAIHNPASAVLNLFRIV
jgi:hypothetical protein